ncbi:GTPase domain-containing protein [Lachnospiraceae bacterium ZAX-1]
MKNKNILVMGKCGTGKSALINAVLGAKVAKTGTGAGITGTVNGFAGETVPLTIYDTVGFELDENTREHSINEIFKLIQEKFESGDPKNYIHVVWYCVNSNGKRFEKAESDIITKLHHTFDLPVLVVLTQCFLQKSHRTLEQTIEETLGQKPIRVLSKDFEIDSGTIPSFGLDTLVNITIEHLHEHMAKSVKTDFAGKAVKAHGFVKGCPAGAFAPISFADDSLLGNERVLLEGSADKDMIFKDSSNKEVIFEGSADKSLNASAVFAATEMPKANIILTGKAGVGKSTLIRNIFGEELSITGMGSSITQDVQLYTHANIPIAIYDTVGLDLNKARQAQIVSAIGHLLTDKLNTADPVEQIHAIWYCVNAGSNRFEDFEAELIEKFCQKFEVPFFVILTQCSSKKRATKLKDHILNERALPVEVILTMAKPVETDAGIIPAFGLDELIASTVAQVPELVKNSVIFAQCVNQTLKRKAALPLIHC